MFTDISKYVELININSFEIFQIYIYKWIYKIYVFINLEYSIFN